MRRSVLSNAQLQKHRRGASEGAGERRLHLVRSAEEFNAEDIQVRRSCEALQALTWSSSMRPTASDGDDIRP